LRRDYLFDLANLCGITALSVDALVYRDFCQYVQEIDGYWERKRKQQESGGLNA
jgi:hypothetical protein